MFSKKRSSVLALVMLFVFLFSQVMVYAEDSLITRTEAEDKYKWDLTEFYDTRELFEADMTKLTDDYLPKLAAFKGKLNTVDNLLAYIELDIEASKIIEKGYVFANLSLDLNQSDSNASEMASIAGSAYSEYLQAVSFVEPELLSLEEATLDILLNDPKLAEYKLYLEQIVKQKEHILSEEEEAILSGLSEILGAPRGIFDKVLYGDYEYPVIKDADDNDLVLSPGVYYNILDTSTDRDLRERAYLARYESYADYNNALSQIYVTEVKANVATAKIKKYDSAIDAALASEFVPKSVYDNLVSAVNDNLEPLHKYYQMKKDALGYEELHGYDTSIPLVNDFNMVLPYDEGTEIIAKGLEPLGEQYVKDFYNGINSRWVDVYEDENKYTGGYQWGAYGMHPYILMNYDNTLDSTLTLAHEMGHAMNTKYSNEAQNYLNAEYPIFTAEVASTVNEFLVMDYLIKNAKGDDEKLFLLNKQIENIRGSIYVQVMFSEFEKTIHEMVEAGEPVSSDTLNNLWLELLKKYFGEAYTVDEVAQVGWSRIPHFYMNFYVYKYATSMAAAYKVVNDIVAEEEGTVDNYLEFLAAGGSDYPIEVLKATGVDMNSSEPVDSILVYFGELVDEMDLLLKKVSTEEKADTEAANTTTYVVQGDDVLWQIADQFETTWEEISELNNLEDPNMIFPGMELVVPAQ